MDTTMSIEKTKRPTSPLVEMIEESIMLMKAYINRNDNCEIIVDRQSASHPVHGTPDYDHVLQTREATSGSHNCYFRQLGAFVPSHISKKEFEGLFDEYTKLNFECEEIHRREEQ